MMLTPKQNLLETIHGGTPEYLVRQHSYMQTCFDPFLLDAIGICAYGTTRVSSWGFTVGWPEGTPGPFPVDKPGEHVINDITKWRDVLKAPDPASCSEERWAPFVDAASKIDRSKVFVACDFSQGIFERVHYLMGIENSLIAFLEEPDAMHELLDYLADWEIEVAKTEIARYHPNALFHCDDFGTQKGPMMSPEVFEEFLVPPYKRIYGFWKDNGVELIVHHNDSCSAELVPHMIEMGVDIWQGALYQNDLPSLIEQYGDKISFQGGINNGMFDTEDWTYEKIYEHVKKLVTECGVHHLVPSFTSAGPITTYEGAFEAASEAIDAVSMEIFGASQPKIPFAPLPF